MQIMWTEQELALLMKLLPQVNFSKSLDDDTLILIEEAISDHLIRHCFDHDYTPNTEGLICEQIIDKLSDTPV